MALALEWDAMRRAGGGKVTRAALAARLGLTRARVTQVLNLLRLQPDARRLVLGLGDPLNGTRITERVLREVVKLALEDQAGAVRQLLDKERKPTSSALRLTGKP